MKSLPFMYRLHRNMLEIIYIYFKIVLTNMIQIPGNGKMILFEPCAVKMEFNPLPDDKIFRLVQNETNCRQHSKVHLKWKICTMQGRKHCYKRRCLLQFLLFSQCFPQLDIFSVSKCSTIVW